ncbi:MAG: HK97 gp10 family phage protein [Oscillospiraceae bacterium]|nr:HK97 gp10 family phage protein [Oscillospiraceae bacterium]
MGNVRFDFGGMLELQQKLSRLTPEKINRFMTECTEELAARLMAKVLPRTPVGQYPRGSGKVGGTLQRGWTVENVVKTGNTYTITIKNPVYYAPYVEYGHRTKNGGIVEGKKMLTISEDEVRQIAGRVLEEKLKKFLEGG